MGWTREWKTFGWTLIFVVVGVRAWAQGGPVGQWNFDEAAGQVTWDASGQGHHGTLGSTGGADGHDPRWVPGKSGTGLSFDGYDRVQIDSTPELEPSHVTVELWARHLGSPGLYNYLIAKGGSHCLLASYAFYTGPGGGLRFYIGNGVSLRRTEDVGTDMWDGDWHHLVGTYDGDRVRLYVDGVERDSVDGDGYVVEYALVTSRQLYIGNYPGTCNLGFNGDLDEVTIWPRALTPSEVEDRFRGVDPHLIGHWTLDENSGTVAGDLSGRDHHGQLVETPVWSPGQQGSALDFGGTDEYVNVPWAPSLDLTDALTLTAWVRPDEVGSIQMLLSKSDAYELEIGKAGVGRYSLRLANAVVGHGSTLVRPGQWQHLAATWDGSNVRYFFNGIADGSASFAGPLAIHGNDLGLGARPVDVFSTGPSFFFDGGLDDLRLYDRVLADSEIADLVADTATDLEAPVRSHVTPSGLLPPGTVSTPLSLLTDESATCRYASTPGVSFDAMPHTFATDVTGTVHSASLGGLATPSIHTLFVRCRDLLGNTHSEDHRMLFGVGPGDLDLQLVGHWPFDTGSGCQAFDTTGLHDATLEPTCPSDAPQWVPGVGGTALDFGGDWHEARVAGTAVLGHMPAFTAAAWVRHPPTVGNFIALIDQRDGGADGYDLYLDPASKPFARINGTTLVGHATVADGSWHHVAMTYDGVSLRLYVDGLLDRQVSTSAGAVDTSAPLRFGRHYAGPDYSAIGTLDAVRIYDRALTDLEIVALYATP